MSFDSARHSPIEACVPTDEALPPSGKGEDEDRLDKVAASPNSQNLTERGI
ncbi:MAG: hypothetical protein JSR39_00895 [Verrucomicrobia bacterium]|nr:hypothetical protein [Verrucomicrobiota bacterium]